MKFNMITASTVVMLAAMPAVAFAHGKGKDKQAVAASVSASLETEGWGWFKTTRPTSISAAAAVGTTAVAGAAANSRSSSAAAGASADKDLAPVLSIDGSRRGNYEVDVSFENVDPSELSRVWRAIRSLHNRLSDVEDAVAEICRTSGHGVTSVELGEFLRTANLTVDWVEIEVGVWDIDVPVPAIATTKGDVTISGQTVTISCVPDSLG